LVRAAISLCQPCDIANTKAGVDTPQLYPQAAHAAAMPASELCRDQTMDVRPGSERIVIAPDTDPLDGRVRWAPAKSLWLAGMTAAAIVLGPITFSWSAFAPFIVASAITLCCGHSVGMHRKLIHASFDCPLWLEHLFVYLGTLVCMAGPFGMIPCTIFATGRSASPRATTIPAIAPASGAMRGGNCIAGWCCATRRTSGSSHDLPATGSTPSSSAH
jgi:hypothetical protein